jgi:hypothetical protein
MGDALIVRGVGLTKIGETGMPQMNKSKSTMRRV